MIIDISKRIFNWLLWGIGFVLVGTASLGLLILHYYTCLQLLEGGWSTFFGFLSIPLPVISWIGWMIFHTINSGEFFNYYNTVVLQVVGYAVLAFGIWLIIYKFLLDVTSGAEENRDYYLNEIFQDSVNLYSCPISADTKNFAPIAKQGIKAMLYLLSRKQREETISELLWLRNMANKSISIKKEVVEKYDEIIEMSYNNKYRFNEKKILKNILNDLDQNFAKVIFESYDTEYLKTRFTDHFFEKDDAEYAKYKRQSENG